MSDQPTVVKARCVHGEYDEHSTKDGRVYGDPYWREAEYCPGGKLYVVRRALGETLVSDEWYLVIGGDGMSDTQTAIDKLAEAIEILAYQTAIGGVRAGGCFKLTSEARRAAGIELKKEVVTE